MARDRDFGKEEKLFFLLEQLLQKYRQPFFEEIPFVQRRDTGGVQIYGREPG